MLLLKQWHSCCLMSWWVVSYLIRKINHTGEEVEHVPHLIHTCMNTSSTYNPNTLSCHKFGTCHSPANYHICNYFWHNFCYLAVQSQSTKLCTCEIFKMYVQQLLQETEICGLSKGYLPYLLVFKWVRALLQHLKPTISYLTDFNSPLSTEIPSIIRDSARILSAEI